MFKGTEIRRRGRGKFVYEGLLQAGFTIEEAEAFADAVAKAEYRVQTRNLRWIPPSTYWLEPDQAYGPKGVRAALGSESDAPRVSGRDPGHLEQHAYSMLSAMRSRHMRRMPDGGDWTRWS